MNENERRLSMVGSPAADSTPVIVAEISGNHGGSLRSMLEHVDAAAAAGVDVIKIQTYTADTITLDHDGPGFRIEDPGSLWSGRTLHDLYDEAHTPWEWHGQVFARAREHGLACFSSPFDKTAVEFLEQFDPPAYKIASFELVDHPLLEAVARRRRTVVLSTGMASKAEVGEAVAVLREHGAARVVLLKCTSAYPAPPSEAHLATMLDMASTFDAPVGLSDHTPGTVVAVAAVALGACLIEKHFVLDRSAGAVDAAFSLEPSELTRLVEECRTAHAALGAPRYGTGISDAPSLQFRRSLYAVTEIRAGEVFSEDNMRSIRPGLGLAPRHARELLGKKAVRHYHRGDPISAEELARPGDVEAR
jgi:N-acetylneuraminate synthase